MSRSFEDINKAVENLNLRINFCIKNILYDEDINIENELKILNYIPELEKLLPDLLEILNKYGEIDRVTEDLQNVGEFLNRLTSCHLILLHRVSFQYICQCISWFYNFQPTNPLQIKSRTWALAQMRNIIKYADSNLFDGINNKLNYVLSDINLLSIKEIKIFYTTQLNSLKETDFSNDIVSYLCLLIFISSHIPDAVELGETCICKLTEAPEKFQSYICTLLQQLLSYLKHNEDPSIEFLLNQMKIFLWQNNNFLEEEVLKLIESVISNPLGICYHTLHSSYLIKICATTPKFYTTVNSMLFSFYELCGYSPRICSLIIAFSNICQKLFIEKDVNILKLYDPVLWPLINLLLVCPISLEIEDCHLHLENIKSCLDNLKKFKKLYSVVCSLWLQFGSWHWMLIDVIFNGKEYWLENMFAILEWLYNDSLKDLQHLILDFRKNLKHSNSLILELDQLDVNNKVKLLFHHCLSIYYILKGNIKAMKGKITDVTQYIKCYYEDIQYFPSVCNVKQMKIENVNFL